MNYERQMSAWALDRAIETMKIHKPDTAVDPNAVLDIAELYAAWVQAIPEKDERTEDEKAQEAEDELATRAGAPA